MKSKILYRINLPIFFIVWHFASARMVLRETSKYGGYEYGFPLAWQYSSLISLSCTIYVVPVLINIAFLASVIYIITRLLKVVNIDKISYKFIHKYIEKDDSESVEITIGFCKKIIWLLGIFCLGYLCLSLLIYEAFDGVRFRWWYI